MLLHTPCFFSPAGDRGTFAAPPENPPRPTRRYDQRKDLKPNHIFLIWSNEGLGGGVPVNTKTSAVNDLRVRLSQAASPAKWQRLVLLRAAPTPGETKRSSGSSGDRRY
jgi:hypothetical protein